MSDCAYCDNEKGFIDNTKICRKHSLEILHKNAFYSGRRLGKPFFPTLPLEEGKPCNDDIVFILKEDLYKESIERIKGFCEYPEKQAIYLIKQEIEELKERMK